LSMLWSVYSLIYETKLDSLVHAHDSRQMLNLDGQKGGNRRDFGGGSFEHPRQRLGGLAQPLPPWEH
jgi:hypothetical protein